MWRRILFIMFCILKTLVIFSIPVKGDIQSLNTKSYHRVLLKAGSYYVEKDYKRALALYQKIIIEFPQGEFTYDVQCKIGYCYYHLKKYDYAIEEFQKAINNYSIDRFIDDIQYRIATCYMEKKEYVKAIKKYEELIINYPYSEVIDNALAWSGYCYYCLGKYNKSIESYNKVITNYPQSELVDSVHAMLAINYSKESRYIQAISELIKSKGYNLRVTLWEVANEFLQSNYWKIGYLILFLYIFLGGLFMGIRENQHYYFFYCWIALLLLVSHLTGIIRNQLGVKSLFGWIASFIMMICIGSAITLFFLAIKSSKKIRPVR